MNAEIANYKNRKAVVPRDKGYLMNCEGGGGGEGRI